MSNYPELLMAAFVELVYEEATAKGLKKGEFAMKVWPESPARSSKDRWQKMRTIDFKTGQPQGVLISDAVRMAQALEVDLAMLMLKAGLRAEEKLKANSPLNSAKSRK